MFLAEQQLRLCNEWGGSCKQNSGLRTRSTYTRTEFGTRKACVGTAAQNEALTFSDERPRLAASIRAGGSLDRESLED